jgi:acyl carrier protein
MTDIEKKVIQVVAETQKMDPARITPTSTFEELGIDSFDGVQLLFAIENEFDIQVSDEQARTLRGMREMIEGVEKLVAAKQAAPGSP